jgi:hypothetical protein
MILVGLIASTSASLSVGATVVRPPPEPRIAIERGAVVVRGAGEVAVGIEGGALRPGPRGTLIIVPAAAGPVRLTLSY